MIRRRLISSAIMQRWLRVTMLLTSLIVAVVAMLEWRRAASNARGLSAHEAETVGHILCISAAAGLPIAAALAAAQVLFKLRLSGVMTTLVGGGLGPSHLRFLLGQMGCLAAGASTALLMLSKLLRPDAPQVLWQDGNDWIWREAASRSAIRFNMQSLELQSLPSEQAVIVTGAKSALGNVELATICALTTCFVFVAGHIALQQRRRSVFAAYSSVFYLGAAIATAYLTSPYSALAGAMTLALACDYRLSTRGVSRMS